MKAYWIVTLGMMPICSGCSKSNPGNDSPDPPDPAPPITITVREKSTNNPIPGAVVSIQRCSKYDFVFGCVEHATIRSLTTNNLGQVTFTPPANFAAISVQHSKYFNWFSESAGDVTLIPRCVIKIHIKKVNSYAVDDRLNIMIGDGDCFGFQCWSRNHSFGLPQDTIAYFEGQGYTKNQVWWYINFLSSDTLHPLLPVFINGFDTAQVRLDY